MSKASLASRVVGSLSPGVHVDSAAMRATTAAQHCDGPNHASVPTESTCAAAMPSRWLLLKSFFASVKEIAAPEEILYRCTQNSTTSALSGLLFVLFMQGEM